MASKMSVNAVERWSPCSALGRTGGSAAILLDCLVEIRLRLLQCREVLCAGLLDGSDLPLDPLFSGTYFFLRNPQLLLPLSHRS